ncbi:DUF6446 family protein [Litorisediminicola beolgyonensis]|uniref:DUF6446 family protein n=1 Tax=Litorisediminicola beolgyonensis TaxID=1173614 RepID=A0ABW3ZH17_9RHOB
MMGKILAGLIVVCALVAGAAMYWLQVYAYYDEVPAEGASVVLTPRDGGAPEALEIAEFQGIDADSSPLRYRACFTTDTTPSALDARFEPYGGAEPRVAPGWFDCFDAEEIGAGIDAGTAQVFLSERNIAFGIDRVVAVTEDGRGYVWQEVNECGDKAYDGTPLGEDCPER